jgi:uncharacterized protein (TIRG00374 family)
VRLKRALTLAAGTLLSVVLLAAAVWRINWRELLGAALSADLRLLAAAALVRFLVFPLRAMRWGMVLAPTGWRGGWRPLFSPLMIGFFTNYLFPVKTGELLRAYLLKKKEDISASGALATIAVEKILDLGMLLALLAIPFLTLPLPGWITGVGVTSLICLLGALVLGYLLFGNPERMEALLGRLRAAGVRVPQRASRWVESIELGFGMLRRGHLLAGGLAVSALIWAGTVLVFGLLGDAMGLSLPLAGYVLLVVVFNLSTIVPSLPGRLGAMEFIFMAVLALFGMSATTALVLALLFRVTHLAPLAVGYLYTAREGYRLGSLAGGQGNPGRDQVAQKGPDARHAKT